MKLGSLPKPSVDLIFRSELQGRPVTFRDLAPAAQTEGGVSLRRYPFPFRCALAVSNDTRGCSVEAFNEIHTAFADRKLELGASVTFDPSEICNIRSPVAQELNEAGLADTLVGLPAEGAAAAVEQLSSSVVRPACFVADRCVADAAMLTEAGLRFFTDSGFSCSEKFGDGYEFKASGHLKEAFTRFDFGQFGVPDSAGTDLGQLLDTVPSDARRRFLIALFNDPIIAVEMPDGNSLNIFKRYCGPQIPAASLLPLQLKSHFLDLLESSGGSVIIQQRLSDHALIGMATADERRRSIGSSPFGFHELLALDDLADRASDRILVTSTGRLLAWLAVQRDLQFEVDRRDRWEIAITGLGTCFELGPVTHKLLEGIAFNVPSESPETFVLFGGRRLDTVRTADPASPGQDCIYVRWSKRSWPLQ